uniref:Carboxylic ester hydrolase n=1 Tax=Leptinotarsa decemlineata TaxID=7539 RepID=A0A0A7ENR4_LEPDE|nr:esterase [Leptinotarsa decemlineata]
MNISTLLVLVTTISFAVADILVTIPNGKLRGRKEYSQRGISFYAFQQIPYAKPPVGELRFREPLPPDNWNGILDATYNDKSCIQFSNYYNANISNYENEDCLYINVYTPEFPSTNLSLPVMYFIYGGGFLNGAANFEYAGPHYLLESGVIVVTVNYRVGAFGFLATGDKIIPGNYGLKDQQMGLKWVQKNIKYFGGDPEKVTIFGQSAGGSSVAFQVMSKGSKGLFRAAIAQSGSNIVPWAYQRSYKTLAFKIGAALGKPLNEDTDSDKLLAFLRTIPAKQLNTVSTQVYVDNLFIDQMTDGLVFTPVIEPEHETAFITENMYEAIENGRMTRVPLMIGMCSEEQLGKLSDDYFPTEIQNYDNDITLFVSRNMHITDRNKLIQVGQTIHDWYLKGRLEDDKAGTIRYLSDASFTRAIIRHAELQSKFSDVYFYEFSYSGQLGGNTGPFIDGAGKVKHSEDLNYIMTWSNWTGLNNYPKDDILTSDRYRTMLTNFAKYLNPTPEKTSLFQNLIWPKVTPDNFQYLNIDTNLSIQKNPRGEIYQKWLKIYEENAVRPLDTF